MFSRNFPSARDSKIVYYVQQARWKFSRDVCALRQLFQTFIKKLKNVLRQEEFFTSYRSFILLLVFPANMQFWIILVIPVCYSCLKGLLLLRSDVVTLLSRHSIYCFVSHIAVQSALLRFVPHMNTHNTPRHGRPHFEYAPSTRWR